MKEYEMKCCPGDEPRILVTEDFVERNKLSINKDAARAIIEIETVFGFGRKIATRFLSFEEAKDQFSDEYVKAVESGKEKFHQVVDVNEATQDFLDYMVFAWMKANDERGLSAGRSIEKLSAWMEILGRKDISDVLNDEDLYPNYGKPALRKACEMLGIQCPDYIR